MKNDTCRKKCICRTCIYSGKDCTCESCQKPITKSRCRFYCQPGEKPKVLMPRIDNGLWRH